MTAMRDDDTTAYKRIRMHDLLQPAFLLVPVVLSRGHHRVARTSVIVVRLDDAVAVIEPFVQKNR